MLSSNTFIDTTEEDIEQIIETNKELSKEDLCSIVKSRPLKEWTLWSVIKHPSCDDDVLDLVAERPVASVDFWGEISESYKDFNKERMDKIWHKKIYPERHCAEMD
jgi:hypothetical protein